MKRIFVIMTLITSCISMLHAQDDDMYFASSKKANKGTTVQNGTQAIQSSVVDADAPSRYRIPATASSESYPAGDAEMNNEEASYYSGSLRSVDEYNRRDRFSNKYAKHLQDSIRNRDSILVSREDYENSKKMQRFDGVVLVINDPWYYDPFFYDPWYYDRWWYGPRWHFSFYDPFYDPWYRPWGWGYHYTWYGPGYWHRPYYWHGGYVTRTYYSHHNNNGGRWYSNRNGYVSNGYHGYGNARSGVRYNTATRPGSANGNTAQRGYNGAQRSTAFGSYQERSAGNTTSRSYSTPSRSYSSPSSNSSFGGASRSGGFSGGGGGFSRGGGGFSGGGMSRGGARR
ncbi:MAG: hypothetical protein KBT34_10130 [Prevotella sp.]|nr:hypothetical protein [Candidatus Prevotella equi]